MHRYGSSNREMKSNKQGAMWIVCCHDYRERGSRGGVRGRREGRERGEVFHSEGFTQPLSLNQVMRNKPDNT